MPYIVELSKNAKVNGKRYKAGQTVDNVSDELFEELETLKLISSYEEVEGTKIENNENGVPEYDKITAKQIQERLTELEVDFEGVTDKKDLYALLVEELQKEGE